MRKRNLVAFLVGAVLFAVVPYFDSEILGEGERGELLISVVLDLVVGATVVLVGGSLAGVVAGHCRRVCRGARRSGLLRGRVRTSAPKRLRVCFCGTRAIFNFVYSFPFVLVGALVAGAALALASTLRRA